MGKLAQTVFIIDDDSSTRDSLCLLLESTGYFVQSFASGHLFLTNLEQIHSGCVLLDLAMPDISGLEIQETLNARRFNIPIIFLTGHGDIESAVKAMKNGAFDYLEKPYRKHELLRLVADAVARSTMSIDLGLKRQRLAGRIATLTRRERGVMAELVSGQTNLSSQAIADRLYISRRTVEHHRAAIMKKTGARSVVELIDMVRLCGLAGREGAGQDSVSH